MKYLLVLRCAISISAVDEVPSDAVQFKRISDGDTVVTTEDTRIQLWGIDSPERDQSYVSDATEALTEILNNQ